MSAVNADLNVAGDGNVSASATAAGPGVPAGTPGTGLSGDGVTQQGGVTQDGAGSSGPNWGAAHWDERYSGRIHWQNEPSPHVVSALRGRPPGASLDVACGFGRNSIWLAQQGWDAHGVDFSKVGLGKAAEFANDAGVDLSLYCADITSGWDPGRTFDLVMLSYLHYRDFGIVPIVERMTTWVADGGLLLVIGFDESSHPLPTGGPHQLDQFYSRELLSGIMTGAGFEIESAQVLPREVYSDDGEPFMIGDTVVLGKRSGR
ncbi:MAG: methyltransferase domain-containing protein [Actinomycetaceae bacterium]|nr:methyltransferase domain-containing protein [Actinomycetaceae bacterium]